MFRVLMIVFASLWLAAVVSGDEKKPAEIEGWGSVTDPDGDCTVGSGGGKLTIQVPAGYHDLYGGDKGVGRRFNAPRVLREVQGDFVAQVKVSSPDWNLGREHTDGLCYHGAGLVLWDSEKQYLRLERNHFRRRTTGTVHWWTTPFYNRDDQRMNEWKNTEAEFFKGRSTWLRLERRGATVTTSISHDGREWLETARLASQFPNRVQIGVDAINRSGANFNVEFEDFKVVK